MHIDRMHPADQLVAFMARIYRGGMTTTSGGNLSILDEDGDIWITPSGIDKGSLTRADMIQVKPDGTLIGIHKPSVELPFHREIYRRRPDLRAIVHAHPPTLVAYSLARRIPDTRVTPSAAEICGKVAMAPYAVPGSAQLGANIAREFEKGFDSVMLENHGVVCGADTLSRAFRRFEALDFCGRLGLNAAKLGGAAPLSDAQLALRLPVCPDSLAAHVPSSEERAARRDLSAMVRRCYDQKLFTSTQGAFSLRLSDGSFLITPHDEDLGLMDADSLVYVKDGACESGKRPSRWAALHGAIYAAQPGAASIATAHSPAAMAFATTGATLDSRTIPESYICLRDVLRLPYALGNVEDAARALDERHPVALIDHQCAVAVGTSLINAFDRMEVLEYSAAAILACKEVGPLVLITPDEVKDIEEAFHLN